MSTEDICAMPVKDIAANDAALFLWTTNAHKAKAFKVIDAWGFAYRSSIIWDKEKVSLGYYVRNQHEELLIAIRGNLSKPSYDARVPSVLNVPKREHSRKPDEVYTIIERMYPNLPKLELFARQKRDGWASWGNEVRRDFNPKKLKRHFIPAA